MHGTKLTGLFSPSIHCLQSILLGFFFGEVGLLHSNNIQKKSKYCFRQLQRVPVVHDVRHDNCVEVEIVWRVVRRQVVQS